MYPALVANDTQISLRENARLILGPSVAIAVDVRIGDEVCEGYVSLRESTTTTLERRCVVYQAGVEVFFPPAPLFVRIAADSSECIACSPTLARFTGRGQMSLASNASVSSYSMYGAQVLGAGCSGGYADGFRDREATAPSGAAQSS